MLLSQHRNIEHHGSTGGSIATAPVTGTSLGVKYHQMQGATTTAADVLKAKDEQIQVSNRDS